MGKGQRTAVAFTLAFVAGFAACLAVTVVTGRKEAWDSSLYFVAAMPAMTVAALALGYWFPAGAWRWALGIALGQSVAMAIGGGSLSLWPLALIAMTVLSLPQLAAALVASTFSPRKAA